MKAHQNIYNKGRWELPSNREGERLKTNATSGEKREKIRKAKPQDTEEEITKIRRGRGEVNTELRCLIDI